MENERIRHIINNKITSLPTLPVVITNILTLVQNNSSSAKQVGVYIAKDQAISLAILRVANSAYYRVSGKVETIDRAIVILGFETVKNLALGTSVFSALKSGKAAIFDREAFWLHAIGVATAADIISKEVLGVTDESFFVSGLFHDIGKIVFDRYLNEEYMCIVKQAGEGEGTLHSLEKKVFGLNHADVGSMLLKRWKIPEHIIGRIKYHHSQEPPPKYVREVAVIEVANCLCHKKALGLSCDPEISMSATNQLRIKEDDLIRLGEKLEEMRDGINSFLQEIQR